jgi:ubiquinone/menaquinone biosynthesis C-methylase UbiE
MPFFVDYIPTRFDDIDFFFDLAPLTSRDVVYDLGSGDGRLLFAALEKGARRAVGIEINPLMLKIARQTAESKNIADRITFIEADMMEVNLSAATVVFAYLYPTASNVLKQKLESELQSGARVVMEAYPMHGWKPESATPPGYKQFYLYIMPPQKVQE